MKEVARIRVPNHDVATLLSAMIVERERGSASYSCLERRVHLAEGEEVEEEMNNLMIMVRKRRKWMCYQLVERVWWLEES